MGDSCLAAAAADRRRASVRPVGGSCLAAARWAGAAGGSCAKADAASTGHLRSSAAVRFARGRRGIPRWRQGQHRQAQQQRDPQALLAAALPEDGVSRQPPHTTPSIEVIEREGAMLCPKQRHKVGRTGWTPERIGRFDGTARKGLPRNVVLDEGRQIAARSDLHEKSNAQELCIASIVSCSLTGLVTEPGRGRAPRARLVGRAQRWRKTRARRPAGRNRATLEGAQPVGKAGKERRVIRPTERQLQDTAPDGRDAASPI